MRERKYSVAEIDKMRSILELMYPWGVLYTEKKRIVETEERLRTHLVNGTSVEELEAALKEFRTAENLRAQEWQEWQERMQKEFKEWPVEKLILKPHHWWQRFFGEEA